MIECQTIQLEKYIDRLKAGDASARDDLVKHASDRLLRLTRKMLKSYPRVSRWEQTDDVFQSAMLRLCRALKDCTPESVRHFFNLAAQHIRYELIDLSRHHFGPEGAGAHHDTEKKQSPNQDSAREPLAVSQTTLNPQKLAQWCEFHTQVDALPEEEREIFNLLWYQGLGQTEAATLLKISERTLQRRWQAARLKIFTMLKGCLPE